MNAIQLTRQGDESAASSETTVEVVQEACADQGALCELLLDWTGSERVAETTTWLVATPLRILVIVLGALLLNRIVRKLVRRGMGRVGSAAADTKDALVSERNRIRAEQRARTIGSLLRSLTTGLIFGTAAVMILDQLGISIVPIIASSGILSLAFGFGAQSVVEDFLRGLFMLGEDQFGVGDRIDIGKVNGFVERVTLRTTVIRDPNGVLWHVPNSEIDYVANEHQKSNRAVVDIGVTYDADIDHAMAVLEDAAQIAIDDPEWSDRVMSEPQIRGV
ncbi:MAG: mechanosensitive ion channel family protein, partial [Acidimicrobiia bacterium]